LLGPAERVAVLQERILCELLAAAPPVSGVPRVTAAVCTHDRADLLARCLASLVALRERGAPGAPRLEILVVDNAPSDGRTRDTVAAVPEVRYACEPVAGLDIARNRAMREATGEFVAYFDDDVTVDPGWLEGFVEAWAAHRDVAAITGPVLPLELATRAQVEFERLGGFRQALRRTRFGRSLAGNPLYPCGSGIFGAGCNMTVRRDVLHALGGFDEALDTGAPLAGGGDLDIFYRLARAGHPIVSEPRCLVLHQHRREYARLRHQLWTWGLGFTAFVAKSYRADPSQRGKFRGLLAWCIGHGARQLAGRLRGGAAPPVDLILAELAGGVVGLCGEYGRSRRRVARLQGSPLTGRSAA
jgi:glycosyltransferase involved in cell wall biosynthesis